MDPRDLAIRLHDILRDAQRIRLPGPGCSAGAAIESIDEVNACPVRAVAPAPPSRASTR